MLANFTLSLKISNTKRVYLLLFKKNNLQLKEHETVETVYLCAPGSEDHVLRSPTYHLGKVFPSCIDNLLGLPTLRYQSGNSLTVLHQVQSTHV